MSTRPNVATQATDITTSEVTVYTCPPGKKARVITCKVSNHHASTAENVTIHIVPYGGSTGTDNIMEPGTPVNSSEAKTMGGILGEVLNEGDSIVALGAQGGISNIRISVFESAVN